MTVEQIIDYVLHTPGNTNPNILRGMLKALQANGDPTDDWREATAEDTDVVKDKTFMGSDGKIHTGTLVIETTADNSEGSEN